jgi:branched-subunit amino acid ABC-type transport system permease component
MVALPGCLKSNFTLAAGSAYLDLVGRLGPDGRRPEALAQCAKAAKKVGFRHAVMMFAGAQVPTLLFFLIAIGLISRDITRRLRVRLRLVFVLGWVLGVVFLTCALRLPPHKRELSESIGISIILQSGIALIFGIVPTIGAAVIRKSRTPRNA